MIVEIYSKDNCIFCEKALSLATMKGLDVTVKKLDVDFDMQGLIEKFPTAKTFPQLIVDDEAIGGYTEFAALVEQS